MLLAALQSGSAVVAVSGKIETELAAGGDVQVQRGQHALWQGILAHLRLVPLGTHNSTIHTCKVLAPFWSRPNGALQEHRFFIHGIQ